MAASIKGLNLKDTSLKGDTISLVGADSLRMNNSTLQLSGNLNIEVTDTTNVYIDGSAIVADSIILSRKGDPTASDNSAFKLDNLSKISGKKLSISGINKFSLMRSKLKLKSIDVKVAQLSESSFDIDAADIIEGVRFDSPIVRGFTIILTRASRSPSIKFSNMRNNGSVNIHLRDPNSDKVSRGDILVELENVRITGEISNEQIAQAAVCRLTSADSLGSSFFVKADEKSLGNINIIPQVGCKDFFAMKRNTPTEVKTSKYIYYGNANT